ncbi:hypothetical protein DF17_29175 [Streptomyces rimosus]|nr:hypothetical protein DF17_29175 [Streptomyces rimosus]
MCRQRPGWAGDRAERTGRAPWAGSWWVSGISSGTGGRCGCCRGRCTTSGCTRRSGATGWRCCAPWA